MTFELEANITIFIVTRLMVFYFKKWDNGEEI